MNRHAQVHAFSGGLALRPYKALSTDAPIAVSPMPDTLVIAMRQHAGPPAEPLVAPGETVTAGQAIGAAREPGAVAVHTAAAGVVTAVDERLVPLGTHLVAAQCIVIATQADAQDHAPPRASTPWPSDRASQLTTIREGGIVGLGGAVFPTDIKLGSARDCDTLIINGAECEPYISCDDMLMREHAASILDGAVIMLELLGATRCLVALERDKTAASGAMQSAMHTLDDRRFELVSLPVIYPAGGERQLVESLLAREVPSGTVPLDLGVVCHNVGTAYALAELARLGRPLTSRIVTVTGHGLGSPRNVLAPIGMPIRDLLAFCGGLGDDAYQLILGGNMMGYALPHADIPVTKATNCIIALTESEAWVPSREWPCIRCGDCASACPARLQPQELLRSIRADRHASLIDLGLDDCIECGCCDVVCPSHIPLTSIMHGGKHSLARYREHRERATAAEAHHGAHVARATRSARARAAEQTQLTNVVTADEDARRAAIDAAVARTRRRRESQQDPPRQ